MALLHLVESKLVFLAECLNHFDDPIVSNITCLTEWHQLQDDLLGLLLFLHHILNLLLNFYKILTKLVQIWPQFPNLLFLLLVHLDKLLNRLRLSNSLSKWRDPLKFVTKGSYHIVNVRSFLDSRRQRQVLVLQGSLVELELLIPSLWCHASLFLSCILLLQIISTPCILL